MDPSALEWAVRLSGQLKTLSDVAESLTYRMLELEERFTGQEDQLKGRQLAAEQRQSDVAEAMEERMRDTDHRLGRIEDLLRKDASRPAPSPSLRALSRPALIHRRDRFPTTDPLAESNSLDLSHGETPLDEDPPFEADGPGHSLAS